MDTCDSSRFTPFVHCFLLNWFWTWIEEIQSPPLSEFRGGNSECVHEGLGKEGFLEEAGQGQKLPEMLGHGRSGSQGVWLFKVGEPQSNATLLLYFQVEITGDAYMVASGLPTCDGIHHVHEIATMSLHFLSTIVYFAIGHVLEEQLGLRTGIHTVDSPWP